MKTKAEILAILRKEKPELVRRYGLKRLALFGSYAREDQCEDSDVDILVEIEPQIGLRFVELADRIEDIWEAIEKNSTLRVSPWPAPHAPCAGAARPPARS